MVTLDQIAQEAGVTRQTVANVLNGRNKEKWGSTARRAAQIREVADRLGYQPNGAAKATATGRFGCVALLLSHNIYRSALPQGLWEGVHDGLIEKDYHLSMFRLGDEELTDVVKTPKILRELMADGILIDYTHGVPEQFETLIHESHLPVIWINLKRENDCVYLDDVQGARDATSQLIELGHRNITYLDFTRFAPSQAWHYSNIDRRTGYEQAMLSAGLRPTLCLEVALPLAQTTGRMRALLSEKNRPSALVVYRPGDVTSAIFAAQSLGMEVPRDLSLVTFAAAQETVNDRTIAIAKLPQTRMGAAAVEQIFQKMRKPNSSLAPMVLPIHFSSGDSIAPPQK